VGIGVELDYTSAAARGSSKALNMRHLRNFIAPSSRIAQENPGEVTYIYWTIGSDLATFSLTLQLSVGKLYKSFQKKYQAREGRSHASPGCHLRAFLFSA